MECMTAGSGPVAQGQHRPFWTASRIVAASCLAGLVAAVAFPLPFGAELSGTAFALGVGAVALTSLYAARRR